MGSLCGVGEGARKREERNGRPGPSAQSSHSALQHPLRQVSPPDRHRHNTDVRGSIMGDMLDTVTVKLAIKFKINIKKTDF